MKKSLRRNTREPLQIEILATSPLIDDVRWFSTKRVYQPMHVSVVSVCLQTASDTSDAEDRVEPAMLELNLQPMGANDDETPAEKNYRQRLNIVKEIIATEQSCVLFCLPAIFS